MIDRIRAIARLMRFVLWLLELLHGLSTLTHQ